MVRIEQQLLLRAEDQGRCNMFQPVGKMKVENFYFLLFAFQLSFRCQTG